MNENRLSHYDFVITILWVGFILAISFMETPLRFQAESITRVVALQVGRLVFHALNYCEMVFALLILVCQVRGQSSQMSRRWFWVAFSILAIQTILLFTILDSRTNAIIENQPVKEAPYHMIYIGLELAKMTSLVGLARCQLLDFKSRLSSS